MLAESLFAGSEAGPARRAHAVRGCDEAILYAYLALAEPGSPWAQRAIQRLNAAIDDAEALCSMERWGLRGGLAGLGWVVEHLATVLAAGECADLNADTDAALLRELQRGRWRGSYGLEDGLVGVGVYFLERLPGRSAAAGLALVVAHLEAASAAYATPGIVQVASGASTHGVEVDRANRLLEAGAERLRVRAESSEPGIAAVCFQVARRTGRPDYRRLARRFLEGCLERSPDSGDVPAPVMAEMAQAFSRIHQSEGDARCRQAARDWIERTLDALARGVEPGDGRAGIALALLAATTPVAPGWDRRILLSGREAAEAPCP